MVPLTRLHGLGVHTPNIAPSAATGKSDWRVAKLSSTGGTWHVLHQALSLHTCLPAAPCRRQACVATPDFLTPTRPVDPTHTN